MVIVTGQQPDRSAGVVAQKAPFVGVLMLDTRFPRPLGDIGNAATFVRAGIAVRHRVVHGASPQRVVHERDRTLLEPFVRAARALVAEGAGLITTSCGFLAAWQAELAAAVPVPVLTSSLLRVQHLAQPGIVTIDAASLDATTLHGAGVPAGTPIEGVAPGSMFHRCILGNQPRLDPAQAEADVVAAALGLVRRNPAVQDLVLECTNMPPYRDAVARATGRRVHDIETMLLEAWRARPD